MTSFLLRLKNLSLWAFEVRYNKRRRAVFINKIIYGLSSGKKLKDFINSECKRVLLILVEVFRYFPAVFARV
jgi:hypothetical protein